MGLYVWRRFVYLLILGSTLYYISIVMEAQPEVKKEESLSKPAESTELYTQSTIRRENIMRRSLVPNAPSAKTSTNTTLNSSTKTL